jgi:hypothetical protein
VEPVQQACPLKPQLPLGPVDPSAPGAVLPQVEDELPEIEFVVDPCTQLMVQLEPFALDEHVMPLADSVPHRQID